MTTVTVEATSIFGPYFRWELPETFEVWFYRESCGYLQAWGFFEDAPGLLSAVDLIYDRFMWE